PNTTSSAKSYQVAFTAADAAGNGGGPTTAVSFSVGAAGSDSTPPTLTGAALSPASLAATGGTITVSVTASDGTGVASVSGQVTRPDGSQVTGRLARASGNAPSGSYGGEFKTQAH